MLLRLIACSLGLVGAALAQVPAGNPYDAAKHPNPIVTFVEEDDFSPSTYGEARAEAEIELLGLAASEATRETVEIAGARVGRFKILGRDTEVLIHPVVRQNFRLAEGGVFVLYSFEDPNPDIPSPYAAAALNEHAFRDGKPEERRFGSSTPPEQLRIRGVPALLFDNGDERTLFWQERGTSHVAVTGEDRETLFYLVDDLL